jgi:ligand-binding sensor domain-containing protein/signal transduction histidine kinase/CheY-like chemotaxis protein
VRSRLSAFTLLFVATLGARTAFALDPARPLTQYVHDVWETHRGLPQATVRAIVQTRDGYLWLGTEEGLARFDGVRFTRFARRDVPAFRANHVLSLLEDRRGNLWIGTLGGGLMRHRNGAFTTFTRADGLPTDYVYTLREDRDGVLWIGARGGIARLEGNRISPWNPPALVRGTIWSIEQETSGAMWVGSDLYGLSRIEDGVPKTWSGRGDLPHDAIPVIRQLRDGRVIIGTNGAGLFEWNDGRFIPFRAQGDLPSASITALFEDSARNLWIGTSAGLARAANGIIAADAPGALGRNPIHAIAEDREGNLWIGTGDAGLHRLREGKARTMTTADGLPSNTVQTVFHDSAGGAWIGTRNGVARIAGRNIATYSKRNGLPNDSVRALFQASDGAIWIGTERGGVVRIAGDRMETAVLDLDIPDNTVRAFAEQPGGGVWVGTNGGPLTLFANGVPVRRVMAPSGTRIFARAMAAEKNGSLWVATDGNGLYHFVDGEFREALTQANGLSRDSLRSLLIDGDGTFWIGTDGGGLNRLKNGKVTVYGTRQGLFDDVVLQILEGDDGRLWMSSNNGIFAVRKDALNAFAEGKIARVESLSLDEHDGMISRDCSGGSQPSGAKSADGRLWFPTNAGVVIVDPRRMHRNVQPPPVHIEQVVADREPLRGNGAFEIPRGTKNLEITYTALSFAVPERVRFRYKLEGYDEQWTDAGSRRTAYYTALPPGQFRFRVIAANDDGVWNDIGATAPLSLAPFFYQRRSFAVLMVGLIGAAIWTIAALRIRRVREIERRLVVAQRMDALGQMASGIAHDFNNALMAASPWADMILRQYPQDAQLQRSAQHISNAIERAKRVTRQLLDFAQPRPPQVVAVDLGELVSEELSMVQVILPREIEIETRLADTRTLATGDKAQLGQVLLNLILNARDAMPDGGRLAIEVREPTPAETASWHLDREKFVLLSVRDSGTGMSAEVRERIFDPFFTTKGVGKGTGLGLAVVHRIVQDHRGAVHVDSAPGKGTTFFVLLPKAADAIAPAPPAASREPAGTARQGLQILFIDDEAVIREAVLGMLGAEGMSVEIASTGSEALRLIAGGLRPDVVILDLGLPEMPGDRVHALIREQLPEVPIIIASGYGDAERLEPLLQDARTAYLQKPYRMNVLLRQIAAMTK